MIQFMPGVVCCIFDVSLVGSILDDRLEGKIPETLKGCPLYSLSCLYVCLFRLSVCLCVRVFAGYRAHILI